MTTPRLTSVLTQQFLAKYKVAFIPHPPYSPDFAPCDFLFSQIKLKLKGRRFDTTEIHAESHRVLDTDGKGLPRSVTRTEETVGLVYTCGRELLGQ
jgi:hypothetical protein